jgi:hypothetical protein
MSFHLYTINELYSNADGAVQFIEMTVGNVNGEGFWAGNIISVSQGGTTHSFTFPTDLPSELTANTTVLIATQGFANLGIVTPDFIIPDGFLFNNGGMVNYAGVDTFSYAQLPTDGSTALYRNGSMAPAVATDFAGASSAVSLISTTVPAVAVEATMYDATGTAAEITSLTTNFLPAQVANATHNGLNPLVYACEALGLVFAFGNETGSMAFSNNFGPSNSAMPNTAAGDAAFATAASNSIFGSASTANLVSVLQGFVSNWEAFFTANGVPGISNPTAAQIDLAARGAAWGDMVGVALANNLGPLSGEVTNFLDDVAQGTAIYGASLVGQPAHQS